MGLATMGVVERANFSASFGATATPIERSWAKLVFTNLAVVYCFMLLT